MFARRLLVAASGGGSFADVPGTIAPDGARSALTTSDYNAFPGLTLIPPDDLFLVYRYGTAHNSEDAEGDFRLSTDLGVTWPSGGTLIVAADAGSNDIRDPAVLRLSTGRLVFAYDKRNPFNSANITAYVRYSDDTGSSWSSAYELDFFSGPLTSVTTSQPVELANGDVVLVGFAQESSGPEFVVMWTSTDEGETFGSAVVIADHVTRDYQEPQLRVLDSGRWLCLMRSESNHHTWRTYSDDDGATWSTPDDVANMTGRPDFVEYRPGRLVLFGRYDTTGDSPGYYAASTDDGATWTTPLEIDTGETDLWMYGAPVVYTPGVVKIVYSLESSSSSAELYFRTFSD